MNLYRIRTQIRKELLAYLRDPKSRLTLVVPPLMQLFIFSFAATLEVRNVDVAVYDRDAGRWSKEMTQRIAAASFVDEIVPVMSRAAAQRAIDRREVLLVVEYPEDFSRDVAAGRTATAQVLADGRRANAGQIALAYVQAIGAQMGAELAGPEARGGPANAIRHWFNPNLIFQWYIVPSLAGILAMTSSLVVAGLSIAREREMGTFDQLLVSPATATEIVIGKTAPALIVGTSLALVMIAAGAFVFDVPFTGSFVLLFACLILYILSVVGVGLTISAVCKTQQQAILGIFSFITPVILVSGFATPIENMPAFLQVVAQLSPLAHFLPILQGSFLKAMPPRIVFAHAWPLAVIALVTLSGSSLLVRRKLRS